MREDKITALCICKDISRIGRDYIRVGLAMETMRINGVRLIAMNDGIDTLKGEDDFTPFRNVMHEFYAKAACLRQKKIPSFWIAAIIFAVIWLIIAGAPFVFQVRKIDKNMISYILLY